MRHTEYSFISSFGWYSLGEYASFLPFVAVQLLITVWINLHHIQSLLYCHCCAAFVPFLCTSCILSCARSYNTANKPLLSWWIAGLVLHRSDLGWLIPFLVYLAITLRILFFHVPITIITKPMHFFWNNTGVRFAALIPESLKIPAGATLVIAVILIGAFASPESQDNTRANRAVSLFGLVVFIVALWATSRDRKMIKWHTVIVGMLVQFIIALFVLRSGAGCMHLSFSYTAVPYNRPRVS